LCLKKYHKSLKAGDRASLFVSQERIDSLERPGGAAQPWSGGMRTARYSTKRPRKIFALPIRYLLYIRFFFCRSMLRCRVEEYIESLINIHHICRDIQMIGLHFIFVCSNYTTSNGQGFKVIGNNVKKRIRLRTQ
jgi:hypothetical protein